MSVLVVRTSPREDSVSSRAGDLVTRHLGAAGIAVRHVDQRRLPMVPAGLDVEAYPASIRAALGEAERAMAVVVAVPIHRSVVSGVARNVVELLRHGVENKLALPLVAAGSQRSTLAAQAFQADLAFNFHCVCLRAVLLSPDVDEDELDARVTRSADELVSRLAILNMARQR